MRDRRGKACIVIKSHISGAACVPCRRKKKRCNAVRPCCNTCQLAHKEDECHYEDDIRFAHPVVPKARQFRYFTYEETSGTGKYTVQAEDGHSSDSNTSQDEGCSSPSPGVFSEPEPWDSEFIGQPLLLSTSSASYDDFPLGFSSSSFPILFSELRLADVPDPLASAPSSVSMEDMSMNLLVHYKTCYLSSFNIISVGLFFSHTGFSSVSILHSRTSKL